MKHMRKFVKDELIQIIQQLDKANELIQKQFDVIDGNELVDLLAECQESAVAVGGRIDQEAGEGTVAVKLLEEYCENLYQLSVVFGDKQESQVQIQQIGRCLKRVIDSIRNDLPDTKEVVFLPYKASMWDSLESVWMAARDDEKCEAYVIPIPYYDKNPDGSFKEAHYEGDQFPEYVPITLYNEYQFEARRPDVIFIHNPYDEWNHVTSIHPFFYSKNLKKFTERLVYIPYFVTPDVLPEGFCVTPGCINANTIIVQSEEVKKNYIYAFEKLEEEEGHKVSFGDVGRKIVVLGSPKLEKALKCTRGEYCLPDAWRKLIEREDGTRRTTVFYNTSLSVILQNDESYLQKLRQVLALFKEREDVVLWWRPHPLSESTLSAMRPELFQEYKHIVQEYQDGRWGIYDETADLYRAIAWCDAYYGDRSSVTMLFTAAQKPVMIQLIKNYTLAFENIVKANGSYWFTAIGYNGLFKLDEGTDTAELVGCFDGEQDANRLYLDIVQYKDKLFFVPLKADAIAVYCMDTKEFIRIPLQPPTEDMQDGVKYSSGSKFTFATVYGEILYLFPSTYPAIIKLNPESYETEYLYEPIKKLEKWIQDRDSSYFRTGIIQGSLTKMWCEPAKAVVEFDMCSKSLRVCRQLSDIDKYIEMVTDGKVYWLIPREQKAELLKLSEDFQIVGSITLPEGIAKEGISYLRGVCADDYLLVFPGAAEHVMKISSKDNVAEITRIFDGEEEIKPEEPKAWKFFFAKSIGDEIIAFNQFSSEMIIYHTKTGAIKKKQITTDVNQKINEKFLLDVLALDRGEWKEELSTYFYEDNRGTLQAYLTLLQNSKKEMENLLLQKWKESKHCIKGTACENAGKSIYEYVTAR